MADHSSTNGTSNAQHVKLAALLRECATYVERNEFHPDMYQALGLLHTYAGEHAGNPNNGASADDHQISPKTSGSFDRTTLDQSAQHLMNSLGKKFSKGLGLTPSGKPVSQTQTQAQATSQKNAERVKADLETFKRSGKPMAEVGHRSKENDWCDEHFCLGCQCKAHQQQQKSTSTTAAVTPSTREPRTASKSPTPRDNVAREPSSPRPRVNISSTTTPAPASRPSKPAFQRPVNPNSILIANGWIEQQRRSKMRVVWKDVLASLVEGRKPGEETTLWIQRETTNPISGKVELEALHQIPMKWLMSVEYLDYSTDNRFALKVYNVPEEFLFRCVDEESAQNWVLSLRSVREIAMKSSKANKKEEAPPMGTPKEPLLQEKAPHEEPEKTSHRMTISELRAIAHGAGISTAGMERRELEEAVANIAGGAQSDTAKEEAARREEEVRRRKQEMDEQRRRGEAAAALEEKRRKQQALEEAEQRQRMVEEAERRKRAAAEEAERRMRLEEERRRKLAEEEHRRRQLAEEERARKIAEEEMRRRKLEDERRRQAEELRRRHQAEEEMRRRKAAEEEQRRRAAEQQAAEQRRRQEDAQRQRWQQDQQRQQWQQHQQQQQQWQQRQQQPQQQWQQKQQQQAGQQQYFGGGRRPASPPGRPPPPPNGAGAPSSPVNQKYAKMAAQDDDDGQAVITAIKHNILVHWALQPPLLQMLRPIDMLITTIHNVFPPAFGVAGHEYFAKWKAVHREALLGPAHRPDEEKLKKSVRKLRFFLHPDKLPRDLNDEQQFMCKMLWDVTSDAWEEFEKHKEELDWIRS